MRMSLVAATALAGSLLIPLLMLGSAQAVTNAPVLKSVVSTNPDGPVTLVRGGGGGGFGGHMGGFGGGGGFGGHVGGFGGHMGGGRGGPGFAGNLHGGPRAANWNWHGEHFDRFHHVDHFHNRRFVNNAFFVGFPGWWGYGYGSSCYWLRRQAIVTGSPYWWSRYQACVGYY